MCILKKHKNKIPYNLKYKLTEPKALRKHGENTFGYFFFQNL